MLATCFTCTNSLNPHNNLRRWALLLSSFYRWGNQGSEGLSGTALEGRIMPPLPPRDVHVLISGTCVYVTLHSKGALQM